MQNVNFDGSFLPVEYFYVHAFATWYWFATIRVASHSTGSISTHGNKWFEAHPPKLFKKFLEYFTYQRIEWLKQLYFSILKFKQLYFNMLKSPVLMTFNVFIAPKTKQWPLKIIYCLYYRCILIYWKTIQSCIGYHTHRGCLGGNLTCGNWFFWHLQSFVHFHTAPRGMVVKFVFWTLCLTNRAETIGVAVWEY